MDRTLIRFADKGAPTLLVLQVPEEFSNDGNACSCYALPIKDRANGLLLCVPRQVISEEVLIQSLGGDDADGMIGPSKMLEVGLVEEDEAGVVQAIDATSHVYVVDFSDEVLAFLSEYDGAIETEPFPIAFSQQHPSSLPDASAVVAGAVAWVSHSGSERVNFYSAREEPDPPKATAKGAVPRKQTGVPKRASNAQVLEQLSLLTEQIKILSTRQETVEAQLSKSGIRAFAWRRAGFLRRPSASVIGSSQRTSSSSITSWGSCQNSRPLRRPNLHPIALCIRQPLSTSLRISWILVPLKPWMGGLHQLWCSRARRSRL